MDRASIYFLDHEDKNTYDFDENLPSLPLPSLRDTLYRYYESLTPFGNAEELLNSKRVIAEFENGIGAYLQEKLEQRASNLKNWLEEWWETYAYHMLRLPLNPYIVMVLPLKLEVIDVPERPELLLKNLARMTYHTIEFWDLLRYGKIKPLSSNGGQIKYSSTLYKRFFSTCRVPGEEIDYIEKHFRTASEGKTPTHGLILGKGRLFVFSCVNKDGGIITPQEILIILQKVSSMLDYEPVGECVPILTHDERSSWARNRQCLQEVALNNAETLKLVESSSVVIAFDENEPKDYEEISQMASYGDLHSKWGDRSSTFIAFRNGKFACVGEHSAYDGSISVSYVLFIQLSLLEVPAPDWEDIPERACTNVRELKFALNSRLNQEIQRMLNECDNRRNNIIVSHTAFFDYGKNFMKSCNLHPDSFVQVIMQLAYTKLHQSVAPCYETALMRHFYNGRTETLRSCTRKVHEFIQIATNSKSNNKEIVNAFKVAVADHNHMMNEARKGHGVDRHLFGLWCVAFENNLDIPDFFLDPLYSKSGGGGNFVLSTSTLGYSVNVGFVAPMVTDGYGVFYTITSEVVFIQTTAFRDSLKTSAHKFSQTFKDTLRTMKSLLEEEMSSKL